MTAKALLIRCSRVRTRLHKPVPSRHAQGEEPKKVFFIHLKGVIHYDDACKFFRNL